MLESLLSSSDAGGDLIGHCGSASLKGSFVDASDTGA